MNESPTDSRSLAKAKVSAGLLLVLWASSACLPQPYPPAQNLLPGQREENKDLDSGDWPIVFAENFSGHEIGAEPDTVFILDGAYKVHEFSHDERCLMLPGSPIGEFGVLFGPRIRDEGLELRFSFFSTKKGRRMPAIAAAIGGIRGWQMRVNPASRRLILSHDEIEKAQAPLIWEDGLWWSVRFAVMPKDESLQSTTVQVKLWPKQEAEPESWLIEKTEKLAYGGGKCVLWGFPYAGTPIFFDDLSIRSSG